MCPTMPSSRTTAAGAPQRFADEAVRLDERAAATTLRGEVRDHTATRPYWSRPVWSRPARLPPVATNAAPGSIAKCLGDARPDQSPSAWRTLARRDGRAAAPARADQR